MSEKKPRGYFEKVLAIDVETSGMFYDNQSDDPSHNAATGEDYQIVSIGLIVADVATFKPIEKLYLEIKWDGESLWSKKAEAVHGLSVDYLEENGIDQEEAVVEIANLIIKYWGPDVPLCLLGHNVATFDLKFLKRLFKKYGLEVRFGNRYIDTFSASQVAFNTFNSDDAFEYVGLPERDPSKHNALTDAEHVLTVARTIRQLWSQLVEPSI